MIPGYVNKSPEVAGGNQLVDGSASDAFLYWMEKWSDIQDHLPTLFRAAKGNVLELGVRGGVSTAALLAGVEAKGGHVYSVDINLACAETFRGHPQWSFLGMSSLEYDEIMKCISLGAPFDLLFIDTDHTYEQLSRELAIWVPLVKQGGKVFVHDVLSYPDMGKAAQQYAIKFKMPYEVRPGSNGLGVLIP